MRRGHAGRGERHRGGRPRATGARRGARSEPDPGGRGVSPRRIRSGGDFWSTINGSRMLTALRAPGQVETRWLTEDIPFGLANLGLGDQLGVETPVIDSLVTLASATLGKDFRSETRGSTRSGCAMSEDAARKGGGTWADPYWLDGRPSPGRVHAQSHIEAMTRTSNRRERAREPRSLRRDRECRRRRPLSSARTGMMPICLSRRRRAPGRANRLPLPSCRIARRRAVRVEVAADMRPRSGVVPRA